MKTMKRIREALRISLREHVGASDAWGTEFGAVVFGRMNLHLLGQNEGTVVAIDFTRLERADVSFLREAVVETLRKHRPRLLFYAEHLSDQDLRENLQLALERRGECLVEKLAKGVEILGKRLTEEQRRTWQQVYAEKEVTSSDLENETVKLSTASSRLAFLWKAGLVERIEGTAVTGGREHRYRSFV